MSGETAKLIRKAIQIGQSDLTTIFRQELNRGPRRNELTELHNRATRLLHDYGGALMPTMRLRILFVHCCLNSERVLVPNMLKRSIRNYRMRHLRDCQSDPEYCQAVTVNIVFICRIIMWLFGKNPLTASWFHFVLSPNVFRSFPLCGKRKRNNKIQSQALNLFRSLWRATNKGCPRPDLFGVLFGAKVAVGRRHFRQMHDIFLW